MSDLDKIVLVDIQIRTSGLTLPGFGVPLLMLEPHSNFGSDLVRTYTKASDLLTDGFSSTSYAYLAAVALFSQSRKPTKIKVTSGGPARQAQVDTFQVTASADGDYAITVNGVEFKHAASGQTVTQIRDALLALIQAGDEFTGANKRYTAATSATDSITVTADTAGAGFSSSVSAVGDGITLTLTTANIGPVEHLNAVLAVDQDVYGLLTETQDADLSIALARTVETMDRQLFLQSSDAAIINAAYNAADPLANVAANVKSLALKNTSVTYTPTSNNHVAAASVGKHLPAVPGSVTWARSKLAGVTATLLTATQRSNLLSHNANGYEPIATVGVTYGGTSGSGEWIDVMHGIHKLNSRIQELISDTIIKSDKVDYTQQGVTLLGEDVKTALQESVSAGLIASSRINIEGDIEVPAFSVQLPTVANIASSTKNTRILDSANPIQFEATLAGAIHFVNVSGTVSP